MAGKTSPLAMLLLFMFIWNVSAWPLQTSPELTTFKEDREEPLRQITRPLPRYHWSSGPLTESQKGNKNRGRGKSRRNCDVLFAGDWTACTM